MIASGATAYRQMQAQTAHPAQLVIQLYDGAIRFTNSAVDAIERGDIEASHNALIRAQDILTELRTTLDPSAGPIAQSLGTMYDVLYRKLVQANLQKNAAPAREVAAHLRQLLAAWEFAAADVMSGSAEAMVGSSSSSRWAGR